MGPIAGELPRPAASFPRLFPQEDGIGLGELLGIVARAGAITMKDFLAVRAACAHPQTTVGRATTTALAPRLVMAHESWISEGAMAGLSIGSWQ